VKDLSRTHPKLAAFRADSTRQAAGAALKAAWWGATSLAMRRVAKPGETPPRGFDPQAAPPPSGFVRRAWLEAFEKDNADVAAGLYPPMTPDIATPQFALRQAADLIADTRAVEARRRRHGATEAREDAPGDAFPVYYRQNFHFQTGGWFTPDSARRYEGQVEALFAGAAGAMRRRALSLLAQAWRGRDQRDLTLVDMACGSGAFLANLRTAFPRARVVGLDLSAAYLEEVRRSAGVEALVRANVERLPFADASLDALTCVYLFHELPPRVRLMVAGEISRVLKPGGVLAFADSIQPID